MFVMKKKKGENGEIIDFKELLTYNRTDGWFICIAPIENPQVAIAVVLEDIGNQFGGGTAAPAGASRRGRTAGGRHPCSPWAS